MDIDEIIDQVALLGGVVTLRPQPGDGSPEISWGDVFFYYGPDGQVPNGQPFATVATKDYPGEPPWRLDRPGAFRLNLAVGKDEMQALIGDGVGTDADSGLADFWIPHPVYSHLGWIAVVNPGQDTSDQARTLLRTAHANARTRHHRRNGGKHR